LRLIEKKNDKVISKLQRECEKIDEKTKPEISTDQKFWRLKQVHNEYTFKRREPTPKNVDPKSKSVENFNHGWKSESQNSERIKELNQRRNKILLLGNFYSKNNSPKSGSTLMQNTKLSKVKNNFEMKQEMLVKAKQLGNQYSHAFTNRSIPKSTVITVAEVDRYHCLMARKREAEKYFRESLKSGEMLSEEFNEKYANVIDELCQLEKMSKLKMRMSVGEFHAVLL
jgi:hypothetical protein